MDPLMGTPFQENLSTNIEFLSIFFKEEIDETKEYTIFINTINNVFITEPSDLSDHKIKVHFKHDTAIINETTKINISKDVLKHIETCLEMFLRGKPKEILPKSVERIEEETKRSTEKRRLEKQPDIPEETTSTKKMKSESLTLEPKDCAEIISIIEQLSPELAVELKTSTELSVSAFAEKVFILSNQLLSQKNPVTQEQIEIIHHLLFETKLKSVSEAYENTYSHPSWAFKRLYQAALTFTTSEGKIKMEDFLTDEFNDFTSEVYVLKNKEQENLWVFKPIAGERFKREGIRRGEGAKREHLAHLLNIEHCFPIPFTAYVTLNGQIGSIQHFVSGSSVSKKVSELEDENSRNLEEDDSETDWEQFVYDNLNETEVTHLVIFDLLFSNTDRGENNFYVSGDNPPFSIYGIDNGCMLTESLEDELSIVLANGKQLEKPFPESVRSLLTQEKVEEYEKILKAHGMQEVSIQWMSLCAELLREGMNVPNPNHLLYGSHVVKLLIKYRSELCSADNPKELFSQLLGDILRCKEEGEIPNDLEGRVPHWRETVEEIINVG